MMPLQRACGAEMQVRNKLSNGPRRAQSKVLFVLVQLCLHNLYTQYSATCWLTLVAGNMFVFCKSARDFP